VLSNSLETCHLAVTRLPVSSSSANFTKKLSTRVDDATLAKLQQVQTKLSSTDWHERMTGIRRLHELVDTQPKAVAGQFTKVCLLRCLVSDCFYAARCSSVPVISVFCSWNICWSFVLWYSFNCITVLIRTIDELL